jgi:hypothetical protein
MLALILAAHALHGRPYLQDRASLHVHRGTSAVMREQVGFTESLGSVFEFDDGKHARPILGVVTDAVNKGGKKGATYALMDMAGKPHSITPKMIHCSYPPSRTMPPGATVEDQLKEYVEIASLKPSELADVEMIELAWEMLSEAETLSAEQIMDELDPELCKSSAGSYKAYRLLTSNLGQIFFKQLHASDYSHREYKPKTPASVTASKEAWCEAVADGNDTGADDWCFVD